MTRSRVENLLQTIGENIVAIAALLLILCVLVYPVALVILSGLSPNPLGIFLAAINSSASQILFTIGQAALSTALAVAIGLPGAVLITRLRFRGRTVARAAILVPFVLPPIVVVVGFLRMFGSGGFLDVFIMWILGTSESVLNLASGLVGIILAHAFYNIPLVILMVSASLERLSQEVEESAEILGASRIQKLYRITYPQVRASILASAILVFLFCFMSFPIVLALGGGSLMTIEVLIWKAFRFFEYGEASALALLQIIVTLALAFSYVRFNKSEQENQGKAGEIKRMRFTELQLWERALAVVYMVGLLILVVGPFVVLFQAAIYDPFAGAYTARGFENLFSSGIGGGLSPLINTLSYSGLATLFAVLLGLPLAYAHRSRSTGVKSVASAMTLLPLGVSAITVAYGLMIAISVPLGWNTNPWLIIVLAQVLIGLPFTVRAIEIALANLDTELLEQADSLGASRLQRFFFVELPIIAPGVLVGAVFAFAMAIGEMSATLFIALPQNITLSVAIYEWLAIRDFVEAGAAALLIGIMCFVAFLVMEKYAEKGIGGNP